MKTESELIDSLHDMRDRGEALIRIFPTAQQVRDSGLDASIFWEHQGDMTIDDYSDRLSDVYIELTGLYQSSDLYSDHSIPPIPLKPFAMRIRDELLSFLTTFQHHYCAVIDLKNRCDDDDNDGDGPSRPPFPEPRSDAPYSGAQARIAV